VPVDFGFLGGFMGLNFGVHSVSPKKGESQFSTFVHIALKGHFKDDAGQVLLSAQLMTDTEVDNCIDSLIEELNKLRSPAKRALHK
jgi:hypothetical protein